MSWLDRILGRGESRSALENPAKPLDWHVVYMGLKSAAGATVTPETALQVPAVWACVNVIAQTIASLPLQVFSRESKSAAPKDPHYKLLHDAPNPETTSFRWRRQRFVDVLLRGASYSWIQRRERTGAAVGLWRINTDYVTPVRRELTTEFEVRVPGQRPRMIPAQDMLQLTFLDDADGLGAVKPMERLKDAIGLYLALQDFTSRFFANDARPGLVLKFPAKLGDTAITNLQNSIGRSYGGENRFRPMVLEEGGDVITMGAPPEQGQLEALRRLQVEEICRVYRTPPAFVQDLTRATFTNAEQQDLHFTKHTILPWLRADEQEMNLKLFGGGEKAFAEYNVDGLLRGDFKTRMDGYGRAIQSGVLKPNEAREFENLQPAEGGDKLLVQVNMTSIERLDEAPPPAPPPAVPLPGQESDPNAEADPEQDPAQE